MIAIVDTLATLALSDLSLYEGNPRKGDIDAIVDSLRVNGQYRPIVVNLGTLTGRPMEVLAGNHTVKAARRLGWDTIASTTVDVDDAAAARIVAVDNRTSDLGEYDDKALLDLLDSIGSVAGTGFTPDELQDLADSVDLADLGDLQLERDKGSGDHANTPILRIGSLRIWLSNKEWEDWQSALRIWDEHSDDQPAFVDFLLDGFEKQEANS